MILVSIIGFSTSSCIESPKKEVNKTPRYEYEYIDVDIQKIRIDDDSEYHISFVYKGQLYSVSDMNDITEVNVKFGDYDKATANVKRFKGSRFWGSSEFIVYLPTGFKIEYFED